MEKYLYDFFTKEGVQDYTVISQIFPTIKIPCTVYTVHSTVYTVQCTLYTVHSAV